MAVPEKPITRKETFLAKAAGQDVPLPDDTLTREEAYLRAIAEGGGGGGTGDGDMKKSVYDKNNNGIVDNAEKVNNHTVEKDVPADAQFTDTIYDDTILSERVDSVTSALTAITDGQSIDSFSDVETALAGKANTEPYFEQSVTLSTSGTTTVTFSNAAFTETSWVDAAVSEWGLTPQDVRVSTGVCTVVMPKVTSAQTVTVGILIKR